MKYLNISIIILTLMSFSVIARADTTFSRDGDGLKGTGPAFGTIRSESIGTKGFKCFSTASKMSWEVKLTASTTDAASIGAKYFFNGDETKTYPITDKFFQFQNSPISKSPTITSVCLRAYSSSTQKTASGIFQ